MEGSRGHQFGRVVAPLQATGEAEPLIALPQPRVYGGRGGPRS
jgi:hypothetical protein